MVRWQDNFMQGWSDLEEEAVGSFEQRPHQG